MGFYAEVRFHVQEKSSFSGKAFVMPLCYVIYQPVCDSPLVWKIFKNVLSFDHQLIWSQAQLVNRFFMKSV